MKKFIILLFALLFISSTNSKKNFFIKTNSIINNDVKYKLSINYPITNIFLINNKLNRFVNNSYNLFLKNKLVEEFNISYEYNILDNNLLSIVLYLYEVYDNKCTNTVFSLNYNLDKNEFISFYDLLDSDEIKNMNFLIQNLLLEKYGEKISLEILNNIDLKRIHFFINHSNIILFFNEINNEVIYVEIPINFFSKFSNYNYVKNTYKVVSNDYYINYNMPMVALTFDDGPSIYTKRLLDILSYNNSRATFFVIGNKVNMYQDIIREMIKNGNEIGNHSYDHKWLTRLTKDEFVDQIDKTQNIIYKFSGYYPKYFRPTYGSFNKRFSNINLEMILWNVDSKDWKYKNKNKVIKNILDNVEDGSIILCHDIHKTTIDAMEELVPMLVNMGYQLVTVSDLKKRDNLYA